MIGGVEIKVCGLTKVSDAIDAASIGADFLGFIFYPKSPRNLDFETFESLRSELPELPKVAVTVAPDIHDIDKLEALGFDFFQIHYPMAITPRERLMAWSRRLTPEKLWLAPKVKPDQAFDEASLPLADTWLWDTYQKDRFGGTGKVGDWKVFKRIAERFAMKHWILAGGLGPGNVAKAVNETGAKRLDLNSGVEKSPGIKDQNKLFQVKVALENR